MKKVKIVFWLLLFGFIALIVFQNKAFFMARHSFQLDLYLAEPYVTPELPSVVIFLAFFFCGLLIAYFYSLYGYFKQNKTIRNLNGTVSSQTDEIVSLRRQLEGLQRPAEPAAAGVAADAPVADAPVADA